MMPGGVDHGPQARAPPLDQEGERLTRQVLPVPAGVRRRIGDARQLLAAAVEGLPDRIEQRPPRVPLRAGQHLGPVQHLVDLGEFAEELLLPGFHCAPASRANTAILHCPQTSAPVSREEVR